MPIYRFGTRYSRWDGTQQIGPLSAEDLMQAMSEDLMQDGDVNRALQRLFRWGFQRPDGENVPGLQGLLQRLRDRRQEQLERYNLQSMLSDIADRIEQIVDTERQGIAQRIEDASQQNASGDGSEEGSTSQSNAAEQTAQSGSPNQTGESGSQSQSGQSGNSSQSGQQGGGEGQEGSPSSDPDLRKLLEQMANRRLEQLDALPKDPAGAIRALQDYDFMTPEARQLFQELLDMLQQQMTQQAFQGMQQSLSQMTPEDLAEMRQMMQELNEMLEARRQGENPNFQEFMHRWGHFFGQGLNSVDDLIERMQQQMGAMRQLMQSMSDQQRSELQGLMQAAMGDEGLRQQMTRLGENLGALIPPEQWRRGHQFSGEESLTLEQAMRLMERLDEYD